MNFFPALLLALPLLTLSCAPSTMATARKNFNARPVDNRDKDIRFTGNHHPVNEADVRPKPIGRWKTPEYPKELREIGGMGKVRIAFVIDAKGRVTQTRIIDADDQLFADAVIESMKSWKFEPALKDGKTVSVWTIIPVRFDLVAPRNPMENFAVFR